jgi:hypothetical protein
MPMLRHLLNRQAMHSLWQGWKKPGFFPKQLSPVGFFILFFFGFFGIFGVFLGGFGIFGGFLGFSGFFWLFWFFKYLPRRESF